MDKPVHVQKPPALSITSTLYPLVTVCNMARTALCYSRCSHAALSMATVENMLPDRMAHVCHITCGLKWCWGRTANCLHPNDYTCCKKRVPAAAEPGWTHDCLLLYSCADVRRLSFLYVTCTSNLAENCGMLFTGTSSYCAACGCKSR